MAQNHNADYSEKPMTTYGRTQGPSRRYRRLRHPTFPAAEWTAKNPLLQRGEIGIESDTHKAKVGDGTTYWNTLPYSFVAETEWGYIVGDINNQTDLIELVDDKVAAEAGLRSDADDGLQDQITDNKDTMDDHIANTNNPHNVTASQVGLGNVDNTSDADKPISTATQNALDLKANIADLGTAAYTDSTDYATAAQGTKADTAVQPGDNVSDLVNDAGYLTQHQTLSDLGITATASEINVLDGITASTTELNYVDGVTSNIQTQIDGKQPKSTSAYNMGNTSGGWTAMSNTQQDALNSGANTTNIGQIATNTSNIADEIINRQNADNGLQSQIDAIVSKSDVVDIVGTYAELQAYDTSSLGNNDVVKVISDSTHNNAPSYYRWVITGGVGAWVYIGSESETYTKAETDALLNAKQDNITATDGITLTGTTLTNSGVRAVASGTANGTISVNTNGTSADVAVTGLGSAAYTSGSDYATSAQGGKADTAVQPGDLATVATSGNYSDLTGKPIEWITYNTTSFADIKTAWDAGKLVLCSYGDRVYVCSYYISGSPQYFYFTCAESYTTVRYLRVSSTDAWINGGQTNQPVISDLATIRSGAAAGATAVQPGDLATVATSGNYNDLSNKPTIPTVNNPTITITQGGVTKGSFTLNQSSGDTIALDAGGGGSIDAIDNLTITKNGDDEIQAVATVNANTATGATNPVYDWVGTLAEYQAQDIENQHPDWICYITDDVSGGASVYTKTEVNTIASGKANVALDNLTLAGKEVCANMAMPSNRYTNLTAPAHGGTWTAPADGWITVRGYAGSGAYIWLRNETNGLGQTAPQGNSSSIVYCSLPAKKGDIIQVGYYAGGLTMCRFIYAQGAQ